MNKNTNVDQRNIMMLIAKDLLYYGYGFKWFTHQYPICIEAGEEICREVWNEALDIMANDF